jgi:hypothetical protein
MTRMITSNFHVDPSNRNNKRRVESQCTLDSRLKRPRVSLQPLPREKNHHHRDWFRNVVRHISPHILRELEGLAPEKAPPVCWTTSQFHTIYPSSIRSFFPSDSNARSIHYSYIPPRIIQLDLLIVLEDSNRELAPSPPPLPLAIRSGIPRQPHPLTLLSHSLSLSYHGYILSETTCLSIYFFMLFSTFAVFSTSSVCTPTS